MRILVRFLTRREGATKTRDKIFDTGALTLGRGTDQTLHIRHPGAALQHATITSREGRLLLRSQSVSGVSVNDNICRSASLKIGDRIGIGDNILTVIEPPDDFDFALTFELDPEAKAAAAAPPQYKTRLSELGLRPRRWAWIATAVVVLAGLLIPALVFFSDDTAAMLRNTPLVPDDHLWLSGPMHNAHRSIGEDCSVCHTPFRRTPNHLCLDCHEDVEQHVGEASPVSSELSERRCQECHKEHNEPEALVLRDHIACTDCHADIAGYDAQTELLDVSGFLAGHAGFSVSLLQPAADGWETIRVSLRDPQLEEKSGLKFPHAKHLAPEGIKGVDGDVVLACADCHLPLGDGAIMRPVNMERDCQSCHTLDFEPNDPVRQVPHAQTDVVIRDMEEYYAWRYLYGVEDTSELGIDPAVFRRPGKIDDRRVREQLIQAAGVKALLTAKELINERTCANCHEVNATDRWPGFVVAPVQLTKRWMPKGRFDHQPHKAFECVDCHAAETSEEAGDVLMPDVYDCGDCHSGSDEAGKITTACIDCHGFHMEGMGQWPH
ncbi:MAG: FHA domain-containing protein [Gammaproteobacteria bacterium]|nr:FHA domain-containing protein [Gammaproteobacteria bacterium]NNF60914.1 FHA domain-containing protein [Gammaproteobacteria bacterium]NNM20533.1 FHA domain-containing protein [Gammaproteobacteria bacterium]